MATNYTHVLELKQFEPKDPRLGRHVAHDSRSLRFLAPARDPRKLASVRHQIRIGLMDQEDVGSCVGHAAVNVLASPAFWPAAEAPLAAAGDPHLYAVGLYSDATKVDPWQGEYEPDDTGTDGLSVAKVLHARGLISGYQHATSLNAALTALAVRPVMIGSSWLEGMYEVGSDGHVRVAGQSYGGHEYALDELDVARGRVWIRNSWGPSWGQDGRAWITWGELDKLLRDAGDCTVLVPRSEPAPTPAPAPAPSPAPAPAVEPATDSNLQQALLRIIDNKNCPTYLKGPAAEWLKAKGVNP